MIAIIRLFLAIVLFLGSLLTIFHAPNYFFWQASIAVDELGHWWAIVGLLLLLPIWGSRFSKTSTVLALVGTVLMLTPIARGLIASRSLPDRVGNAFGAV